MNFNLNCAVTIVLLLLSMVEVSHETVSPPPMDDAEYNFLLSGIEQYFEVIVSHVDHRSSTAPADSFDKAALQDYSDTRGFTLNVTKAMKEIDRNGDGFASFEEFLRLISSKTGPTAKHIREILHHKVNKNAADKVMTSEDRMLYIIGFPAFYDSVEEIDGRDDGFFTEDNLKKYLETKTLKEKGVEARIDFSLFDTDSDGEVTRPDFDEYMVRRVPLMAGEKFNTKKKVALLIKQHNQK